MGIKASFTAIVGFWAILAHGAFAGEQPLSSQLDISTDLFQVSPDALTITRDLVPQLVFDKKYDQQAPIEELLQGPDTVWLEYLHQSKPTAPFTTSSKPVVEDASTVTASRQATVETFPETLVPPVRDVVLPISSGDGGLAAFTVIPDSVPDPGPLGFLGLGLIALALVRRRRKIKKGHIIPAYGV